MFGLRRTPADEELEREFASLIALLRFALRDPLDRDALQAAPVRRSLLGAARRAYEHVVARLSYSLLRQ